PRVPAAGGAPAGAAPGSLTLRQAAATGVFWVLTAAFFVGNFTTNAVTTHLIPFLTDHGYAPATAAAVVGWMGAMQLPARLLFARIAAAFGAYAVTAAVFFGQAAGVGQLAFLAWLPTLAPAVVVLGAANGMATLARATTVAEIFGPAHYGSISGAVALGTNGARAVAPVGASLLMLGLGGYERLFGVLGLALLGAGLAVVLTRGGRCLPRP
ncbi:MAG TPA: MFS transporter, partial [Calidithermus sp.]|nr:MFS transporter [Calidithermus sp.]